MVVEGSEVGFEGVGGEFEELEFALGSLDFPAALSWS